MPPLKRLHPLTARTKLLQVAGFWRQARVRRSRAAGGRAVTNPGAARASSRSARAGPHPRAPNITSPPAAPRLPPNQIPRMRHCRRADTPAPGLRPATPASPQHQGLGNSPSRARILRAALLPSSIPGSTPLRFPLRVRFPLRRSRLRDGSSSNEQGGRVYARVCARACACACAREGHRAPLRARSCLLPCTLRCQQNP